MVDRKDVVKVRITDDDKSDISVTVNGKEVRGWTYANDDERRQKTLQACEYVEGWSDGWDARDADPEKENANDA